MGSDDSRFNEDLHWDEATADTPTCEECSMPLAGLWTMQSPCRTGKCTVLSCVNCGHQWGSVGPVDCPSCGELSWWERPVYRFLVWVRGWRR